MAALLLINGPNMGRLGRRETEVYGRTTLAEIESELGEAARSAGHELDCFQSDAEHELMDRIHRAADEGVDLILFNPAAFTHTSVALRDAIGASGVPFIEIHMSNPAAREPFRRHSYFSDLAVGVVAGFGATSYRLALEAALERLPA